MPEAYFRRVSPSKASLIQFNPDSVYPSRKELVELFQFNRPDTVPIGNWCPLIFGPYQIRLTNNEIKYWVSYGNPYSSYGNPRSNGDAWTFVVFDSLVPKGIRFQEESGANFFACGAYDFSGDGQDEIFLCSDADGKNSVYNGFSSGKCYVKSVSLDGKENWFFCGDSSGSETSQLLLTNDKRNRLFFIVNAEAYVDTQYCLIYELDGSNGKVINQKQLIGNLIPTVEWGEKSNGRIGLLANVPKGTLTWVTTELSEIANPNRFPIIEANPRFTKTFPFNDTTPFYQFLCDKNRVILLDTSLTPVSSQSHHILSNVSWHQTGKRHIQHIPFEEDTLINLVIGCLRSRTAFSLLYPSPNPYWWFWRYRWILAISGFGVAVVITAFSVKKYLSKKREQQTLSKELKLLQHELEFAEEEERRRLAKELHDTVAQNLVAMRFQLDGLETFIKLNPEESVKEIRGISSNLRDTIREVREISHKLLPAGLEALGLVKSAQTLCTEFAHKNSMEVVFHESGIGEQRFSQQLELAVFRVLQESLNNIRKYANATIVTISLSMEANIIVIDVVDNGTGFEVDQRRHEALTTHHLGLFGMEERIKKVGGIFQIESKPGSGTRIHLLVPVLARK
ncbi:MAG: sensor histidine kinase [bacterium]|nr:sensor histidine kinase [bacterium]